ncbi:OmpA family protein [Chromatium okenii]|jgi:outer membrane protein OmpA-like peptidoglycan-associated protein|uniref:OmpA family protein n=2 Tax=Chromatium okenii TaxID=61644 RepID=UPI0026E9F56B|nr:OmpA family protein [Chromatium okenii]MBV5310528.1 OmpA family protein [Chromatium okenii]
MKRVFAKSIVMLTTVAVVLSGCATTGTSGGSGMSDTGQGAVMGTVIGAAAGALIGSKSANAGRGALIGAIGGALAGTAVGAYMEKQRQDFEKVLADEIASGMIRVQKLPNDELLVGMTGETTFEVDSDRIKPGFYSTMDKIAAIVNKYGKTALAIAGHTDSTGSATYNQTLSERRAGSVEQYLSRAGVASGRLTSAGFGKDQPIASNASESGRRLNRRVDITIVPITDANQG